MSVCILLSFYIDGEEQFLVLAEDKLTNPESLEVVKGLLTSAAPLKAELDRNLQVFRSSPRVTHFDLPNEFYKLSMDEIKKEQKLRQVDRCDWLCIPPRVRYFWATS